MNLILLLLILNFNIILTQEEGTFECTNGKDPSSLTNKEYLIEFSKGKCSPFVLVPPMTGTKLRLFINCEVLKRENLEIFKSCGWNSCKKNRFEFWKSVPKNEYPIWNAPILGPLTWFSPFKNSGECFSNFFKLYVDFKKPLKDSILKTKGYQIRVLGQKNKNDTEGKCGNEAISNLQVIPILKKDPLFLTFIKKAEKMGYKRGLTYQSLPYDWRRSFKHNRLEEIFEKNLERIFRLTKKKIVIVSHSHGVRVTYYRLLKMKQEKKDLLIKSFVSAGGNFLGCSYTNMVALNGIDLVLFKYFGLSYKASSEFIMGFFSAYETRVVDPFSIFEGEQWFESVKKRMEYELGNVPYKDSGFEFLPSLEDKCSSVENVFDQSCVMGFFDSRKYPTVVIGDRNYFKKNLDQSILDYPITNIEKDFLKITKDDEFYTLKNPGVVYIPFILRTYPTPTTFIWKNDIKKSQQQKKFYNPEKIIYSYGDNTVDTTSSLLAPLKWAFEFDNKSNPNAKPVKIIDLCSTYNEKYNIYDKKDKDKEFEINKNEFIGNMCDSFHEEVPSLSNHASMVKDSFFMKTFANVLKANEISYTEEFEKIIEDFDDGELEMMVSDNCPQIRYEYEDY